MLVKTYTALEGAAIDIIATQLTDCHCCVLVSIHLNKCKTSICLKPRLNNKTEVLEQWNEIILGGVWSQIANIASRLPGGSLRNNHVIALNAMSWEVMMSKGSCWGHSHC